MAIMAGYALSICKLFGFYATSRNSYRRYSISSMENMFYNYSIHVIFLAYDCKVERKNEEKGLISCSLKIGLGPFSLSALGAIILYLDYGLQGVHSKHLLYISVWLDRSEIQLAK